MLMTAPPQTGLEPRPSEASVALVQIQMLAEIFASASEDQAHAYLKAVGARIAGLGPVAGIESVDDLTAAMNDLWTKLEWGSVSLALDAEGIDIVHDGMPVLLGGDSQNLWRKAAPWLLAGAYDCWLREIGSTDKLQTRLVRQANGRIELRHGL